MVKYKTVIADPPWEYNRGGVRGGVDYHYPTMTLAELLALPMPDICAADSVMLLWATWPKLAEACLPLLAGWGFKYVTGFPIKITEIGINFTGDVKFATQYGPGFWVRGASEMVLIGVRGHVAPPKQDFIGLLSKNLGYSRKPEDLYTYAETLPGPYLELFARRARAGWDVFGNQVAGSIEL